MQNKEGNKLSYYKVSTKALLIDLSLSIFISVILLLIDTRGYLEKKHYLFPFVSAIGTIFLSIGIVFKEKYSSSRDKTITGVLLSITCVFLFCIICISFYDITILPGLILLKFPLSVITTMFLPSNFIVTKQKNRDKLDPKKRITDDLYYY